MLLLICRTLAFHSFVHRYQCKTVWLISFHRHERLPSSKLAVCMTTCSAYPLHLFASKLGLCAPCHKEMADHAVQVTEKKGLSAGSHHPDHLSDRVPHPRALHHLQPNKLCTQMCSRTSQYIHKPVLRPKHTR